jgi:glycerophosphoryl diester phosphodiesterase
MKRSLAPHLAVVASIAAVLATAPATFGAVVITEFMADPSGTDADREWMEIYNNGLVAVDLTNWAIGDEETRGGGPGNPSTGEAMFRFPAGTTIQPGQVFTIGVKSTGFSALYPGLTASFEVIDTDPNVPNMVKHTDWFSYTDANNVSNTIGIANGSDEVILLDASDNVADATGHGASNTVFPDLASLAANASLERALANVDTNTSSDWITRGAGNATPGAVVVPEPGGLCAALGLLALAGARRPRRALRGTTFRRG